MSPQGWRCDHFPDIRNMILYTDNDPKICAWLWELQGVIPKGLVSEQDILNFKTSPYALKHYTQAHFFAGIGGWPYALQLAGWPSDRKVWTASCPCQPFSCAGKAEGILDERHVWPAFRNLVAECKPPTIFGEQVASKDGRAWLAGIRADLEALGYAVGAADLCAAGIGAPHIRQRLYWVAHVSGDRRSAGSGDERSAEGARSENRDHAERCGEFCCVGNTTDERLQGRSEEALQRSRGKEEGRATEPSGGASSVADGGMGDAERSRQNGDSRRRTSDQLAESGFWSGSISIACRDGKKRRAESGIFPLAARLPRGVVPSGDPGVEEANGSQEARVMRLQGYGNSIVPQLAAEFVKAFMETL